MGGGEYERKCDRRIEIWKESGGRKRERKSGRRRGNSWRGKKETGEEQRE